MQSHLKLHFYIYKYFLYNLKSVTFWNQKVIIGSTKTEWKWSRKIHKLINYIFIYIFILKPWQYGSALNTNENLKLVSISDQPFLFPKRHIYITVNSIFKSFLKSAKLWKLFDLFTNCLNIPLSRCRYIFPELSFNHGI